MSTIKISELATGSVTFDSLLAFADSNGIAFKSDVNELNSFINAIAVLGLKGAILTTDSAPTEDGLYPCSESGTYTNFDGLVIDISNNLSFISVSQSQTVFAKVEVPITVNYNSGVFDETDNLIPATQKSTYDYVGIEQIDNSIKITDGEYLTDIGTTSNASFEIYDYIKLPKHGFIYIDAEVIAGAFNFIQFYNKGKGIIESIAATTINHSKFQIIPSDPDNAVYVRFSHRTIKQLDIFIDKEAYSSYILENSTNILLNNETSYIQDINWSDGFYLNSSGVDTSLAGWSTSNFIKTSVDFNISGTFWSGAVINKYAFYDDNKVFISASPNTSLFYASFTTVELPVNTAFIKVSTQTAVKSTIILYLDVTEKLKIVSDLDNAAGSDTQLSNNILISGYIDVVEGKEFNLFLDNVTVKMPKLYNSDLITSNILPSLKKGNKLKLLPTSALADYAPTIDLVDENVNTLSTKTFTVRTHAPSGGAGQNKSVMIMGDSLTDYQTLPSEIFTLLNADADYTIEQIGTRGVAGGLHEGRSSWRWQDYISGATYAGKTNAFWNSGALDFQNYVSVNSFSGIEFVLINLGTNDVQQGEFLSSDALITSIISNAKVFIDALLADYPSVKIGIILPSLGSPNSIRHTGSTYFRTNIAKLSLAYLSNFDNGVYSSQVTTVSMNLWIDRDNAYPITNEAISTRDSTTINVITDMIHPSTLGFNYMADAYYAKIRAWFNGVL